MRYLFSSCLLASDPPECEFQEDRELSLFYSLLYPLGFDWHLEQELARLNTLISYLIYSVLHLR